MGSSESCEQNAPEHLAVSRLQQLRISQTEKCYNPSDSTLTFANADDDHDFECEGYSSKRARMSCGHTVTPTSLTKWCQRQLNQGKSHLECGVCNAKWTLDEVSKMALLTDQEKNAFDKKLCKNFALNYLKVKFCPGCKSQVLRKDPNHLCVRCPQCTADRGKAYDFCWQCLKKWKGPTNLSDHCGNAVCVNPALVSLQMCNEIEFNDVKGINSCPSIRACPTCGLLVQHQSFQCKNVVCEDCKVEFCFVCLKITKECLKTSTHFSPCSSGVAPRQTSIPVKK